MKSILLLFTLLTSFSSYATHIIGGEIKYEYQGDDIYKITLLVYRDCLNGQAPFDDPGYIGIYDGSNNLVEMHTVALLQVTSIPVAANCAGIPSNICAEQGIYETIATLPPLTGGYTLTYQRCCRSQIIGNLVAPLDEGMTISTTIPDPALATDNNSPAFENYPPTAFCVGIPIYFDHAATDADGDSLVYEFCNGVAGADAINPMPAPAPPPPYASVIYLAPYSGAYPFNSDPPLAINAQTGLITGTPASIGVFTLGINVKEYRNGILIGEHRREMAEVYTVVGLPTEVSGISTNDDVFIYPVPSSDALNIVPTSKNKIKEVKIFDLSGRLLYHEKMGHSMETFTLSLSNFNNGEYQLQLIREFSVQTTPFIVAR